MGIEEGQPVLTTQPGDGAAGIAGQGKAPQQSRQAAGKGGGITVPGKGGPQGGQFVQRRPGCRPRQPPPSPGATAQTVTQVSRPRISSASSHQPGAGGHQETGSGG